MTKRWLVILDIDKVSRIIETDDASQLYRLAAEQYMRDVDPGPRPADVKWYNWPMVFWPTCAWSRRRLRDDEPLDPMPTLSGPLNADQD